MPRCLELAPHLSVAELEHRYRLSRDPVERSHWHMLWLIGCGHTCPRVAALLGYSVAWVRTIVHRYNAAGPAGVSDHRHANPGQPPLLSPALRTQLRVALATAPPDGGLWTSPKVAAWLTARLDRPVSKQRAWEALQAVGFTPHVPRPRDPRRRGGSGGLQKRGLRDAVDAVRAAHPTATVALWAEDEHRLGLLPVVRRIWAPHGTHPTALVQRRYQWMYVYGFVRPTTGQSWWCLLPMVNTAAMQLALAHFAHDEGIDAEHRAVLVWDGAGWHTSDNLVVPAGIDLVPLPPASPELQPAERLWPLVNEPVANHAFPDLDALESVLVTRCQTMHADHATIRAQTCFHWWPSDLAPALWRE